MDINDLRSIFTVLVVVLFAVIVKWAYSAKQKGSFEAAAKLAIDDDDSVAQKPQANSQHN